jgi:hypothetical protein
VDLIYVQRCQSIVTVVAIGCGPMVSPWFGRRLGSPPGEQQSRTSHLMVDAGPCIVEWLYFGFCFRYVSKLEHFIIYVPLL